MIVSYECLIDMGRFMCFHGFSSLGHKMLHSTGVKTSCIFLCRREVSKGEGKQN